MEFSMSDDNIIDKSKIKKIENEEWYGKKYSYFQNKECEYFPCHKYVDVNNFNCLFCFCPLYTLGEKCGGDFRYIGGKIKDCTQCTYPHKRENYGKITAKYGEIINEMEKYTDNI